MTSWFSDKTLEKTFLTSLYFSCKISHSFKFYVNIATDSGVMKFFVYEKFGNSGNWKKNCGVC